MNELCLKVKKMHQSFNIDCDKLPISYAEIRFRKSVIKNKIDKAEDNYTDNLKGDELKSYIDIIIMALGSIERRGWLPNFSEAFDVVIKDNLQKYIEVENDGKKFSIVLKRTKGRKKPSLDAFTLKTNGVATYHQQLELFKR